MTVLCSMGRSKAHLAEATEGMSSESHDLVVVEVEVIQVLEVLDGLGGDLAQLVLGEDKVAHGVALRRN